MAASTASHARGMVSHLHDSLSTSWVVPKILRLEVTIILSFRDPHHLYNASLHTQPKTMFILRKIGLRLLYISCMYVIHSSPVEHRYVRSINCCTAPISQPTGEGGLYLIEQITAKVSI